MVDEKIFTFTVYNDETTHTVYWDADIRIKKGEDWLKVLRMLKACDQEIMDIILKNTGIVIDNEHIRRRTKSEP